MVAYRPDEIVQQIDPNWSKEKIDQVLKENNEAKLRHAQRREEEWFNKKSLFERGIDKAKALIEKLRQKQRQRER